MRSLRLILLGGTVACAQSVSKLTVFFVLRMRPLVSPTSRGTGRMTVRRKKESRVLANGLKMKKKRMRTRRHAVATACRATFVATEALLVLGSHYLIASEGLMKTCGTHFNLHVWRSFRCRGTTTRWFARSGCGCDEFRFATRMQKILNSHGYVILASGSPLARTKDKWWAKYYFLSYYYFINVMMFLKHHKNIYSISLDLLNVLWVIFFSFSVTQHICLTI